MITLPRVADVRQSFKEALADCLFVTDKTGVKTIELVGSSFIADEPAIFGSVNLDYAERELEWYRSMSLRVSDIPGGAPKIWEQVASSTGLINSNYGWAIWSHYNGLQYDHVLLELVKSPNSRRAVMIYTRPTMHTDYNYDGMSDFMCTNTVQYVIRDNKLHTIVQMRSNDVVFGFKNDFHWQKHVRDKLLSDLNERTDRRYQAGDIIWNAGSLHVYERHFNLIK